MRRRGCMLVLVQVVTLVSLAYGHTEYLVELRIRRDKKPNKALNIVNGLEKNDNFIVRAVPVMIWQTFSKYAADELQRVVLVRVDAEMKHRLDGGKSGR